MTGVLDNVNFQLLLKQHGGNMDRALVAWRKILSLGGFGDVPHTYEGGLDVQSLRVTLDERKQKQAQAEAVNIPTTTWRGHQFMHFNITPLPEAPADLEDRIKQIEDIASGDKPKEN